MIKLVLSFGHKLIFCLKRFYTAWKVPHCLTFFVFGSIFHEFKQKSLKTFFERTKGVCGWVRRVDYLLFSMLTQSPTSPVSMCNFSKKRYWIPIYFHWLFHQCMNECVWVLDVQVGIVDKLSAMSVCVNAELLCKALSEVEILEKCHVIVDQLPYFYKDII